MDQHTSVREYFRGNPFKRGRVASQQEVTASGRWMDEAFRLAQALDQQGDVDGARSAYQQVIDSGHAEHAPAAAFKLGLLLGKHDDLPGARTAYEYAATSGHPEYGPMAASGCAGRGPWVPRYSSPQVSASFGAGHGKFSLQLGAGLAPQRGQAGPNATRLN